MNPLTVCMSDPETAEQCLWGLAEFSLTMAVVATVATFLILFAILWGLLAAQSWGYRRRY